MSAQRSKDSTGTIMQRLLRSADIKSFLDNNGQRLNALAFPAYLAQCCERLGEPPDRVIKRTDIERSYGHQIFNGTRTPSRDKVIQLAFGFGFDVEDTQKLLRAAGKSALYPKLKRDAAIIFCLHRQLNIYETQALLDDLGLTILGGQKG